MYRRHVPCGERGCDFSLPASLSLSLSLSLYRLFFEKKEGPLSKERVNSSICARARKKKKGKGKGRGRRKGLRTPFDQLGLINGVHGGVVDDDEGGREGRSGREILLERAVRSVGLCY